MRDQLPRIVLPLAGYLLCGYAWFSGVHVACKTGGKVVTLGGSGLPVLFALLLACVVALVAGIWTLTGVLRGVEWLVFLGIGVAFDVVFSLVHLEWLALVPPAVYAINLAWRRLEPATRILAIVAFLLATWLPVLLLAAVAHTLTGCTAVKL